MEIYSACSITVLPNFVEIFVNEEKELGGRGIEQWEKGCFQCDCQQVSKKAQYSRQVISFHWVMPRQLHCSIDWAWMNWSKERWMKIEWKEGDINYTVRAIINLYKLWTCRISITQKKNTFAETITHTHTRHSHMLVYHSNSYRFTIKSEEKKKSTIISYRTNGLCLQLYTILFFTHFSAFKSSV